MRPHRQVPVRPTVARGCRLHVCIQVGAFVTRPGAVANGLPIPPACREAVGEHVEFGSQVAMQNSHADRDGALRLPAASPA
jgi:hypothetical protein